MKHELIPFIYEDRPVRVVMDEKKEPWWVAKDVCDILGTGNVPMAMRGLDDDEKKTLPFLGNTISLTDSIPAKRGNPALNLVNEPGLYTLIIRSDKPAARVFRRWITHEVLPALRKTGQFAVEPAKAGEEGSPPSADRHIPPHVWERIRVAGRGVRISYRVKLLHLACQMNRLDQTTAASRAGVLLDYAELCANICGPTETPLDLQDKSVRDFVSDCCFLEPGAKVQAAVLYASFTAWHEENIGDDTPSATTFGRRMGDSFKKAKSNGCVMYFGIGLKEE